MKRTITNICLPAMLLLLLLLLSSCAQDPYAETRTYHMITVGYDYTDSSATTLKKDIDDAVQVAKCFKSLTNGNIDIYYLLGSDASEISKYTDITDYSSPTIDNIKSAIDSVAASATEADITFFYFSGHGASEQDRTNYNQEFTEDFYIATKTTDTSSSKTYDTYDLEDLLERLDTIPGKVLILGDFCYSGGVLHANNVSADSSLYDNVDLFNIFFNSQINVEYPDIYALTASSYYTTSTSAGSKYHSKFTQILLKALGWDDSDLLNPVQGTVSAADGNTLTLSSLYNWVYENGGVYGVQRPVATSTSADLVIVNF
ncbi:MAG: caspase family protein [Sphaerochaetaceae bacterium]|nr:caspase family protein [Sphaerochaetaceae bacterium]